MRFRLPSGGGTFARRFWMKDRVSLLFKFVRNTVRLLQDVTSGLVGCSKDGRPWLSNIDSGIKHSVQHQNKHKSYDVEIFMR